MSEPKATLESPSSPVAGHATTKVPTHFTVTSPVQQAVQTAHDVEALLDSLENDFQRSIDNNNNNNTTGSSISSTAGHTSDRIIGDNNVVTDHFDPIQFLNKHYATEAALAAQLPTLREAVQERMWKLDDRIQHALQRQSETADQTRKHVQDAKASVRELQLRIQQIREKAAASERAVLEITSDMKRLDCAKKHLQRTITTLKQLHMLVHAVEQLRQTTQQKPFPDYKTAAHLIEAIQLLLGHFSGFADKVQPMRVLTFKVKAYQEVLRLACVQGFHQAAKTTAGGLDRTMPVDVMQGGVMLLDALGETVRNQFIHEFCQEYLGTYLKEFEPPSREVPNLKRVSSFKVQETKAEPVKSHASLDQLEKRFAWFRDVLQSMNATFTNIFPSHWNLQATMAAMFLQLTRDHVLALLDGPRKDPDATNATVLLKALQKTLLFEKDTTAFVSREFGTIFESSKDAEANKARSAANPLIGIASAAFEAYMDPYIRLEEQSMDEQLVEALEDRTVDTRGERPVFISSTNLFVYIKGSITRCTALTKGKTFLLLHQAFKDSLRKYAQILNGKLPPAISNTVVVGAITMASFGGKNDGNNTNNAQYRLPMGEEITVCHVVSTCEYCADTVEALEDLIRETIDEDYKDKINMLNEQEVFHDTTAKAIRVLVSGLSNRTENSMKTMSSINWGAWDAVGEESVYVRSIHEEIEPAVTKIRSLLPTSYFRSFCDKFATLFTSVYYDNLTRLKRISEPGTQQLLLDVYSLKTLFLKLPILEESTSGKKVVSTGSTIAPAIYTKMVQKQFGRIEMLLKLVGTPNELLIDNFKVQWVNAKPADLQIVMNLKGLKRAEQIPMLEKFGVDSASAVKVATAGLTGAHIISERVQTLQDQGSNVAAKVNSDFSQMRQKVDDLYKSFR